MIHHAVSRHSRGHNVTAVYRLVDARYAPLRNNVTGGEGSESGAGDAPGANNCAHGERHMSGGNATGTVTIIGDPIEGQVLEAQAVGIADPDGVGQIFYGWGRFDGPDFITVSEASPDPHYTVARTDVGQSLVAAVVFFDGTNSLEIILSAFTEVVTGTSNNEPTGAPTITGTPLVGETLTADASSIVDDDGLGPFSYSWVRVKEGDSSVVGNTDTYTLTADDAHARLKVIVSYQDGGSSTEDVESALTASVASTPDDIPPRIEFLFGDNKINENEAGVAVGTLLFDGIIDPSVTYTIVSDPAGRFEMSGSELKLTSSTSLDFEASATQQVQIRVTDGGSLDYVETVTVAVIDRTANPDEGTHAPIADPVVAADVAGLVFPGFGDPLNSRQWINESQIAVTFESPSQTFIDIGTFARRFSNTEMDTARGIFASVSDLVPLSFPEVPGGSISTPLTIDMAIGALPAGLLGIDLTLPGSALLIGLAVTHGNESLLGGDFHFTLMHEFGHALGLDHGINNAGTGPSGDSPPHVPLEHDRSAYSVMILHDLDGVPQSYMIADIATLQYLYGADFTTNSGDTTYTWSTTGETFIDGVSLGETFDTHILMSIWDGGGIDTYDASNYGDGVEIDLRPGEFSTISANQLGKPGAIGNVGNAYLYYGDLRSLIENAIGGAGDDTLTGNEGDNEFTGGAGANTIDGGTGNDTAAFLNNRSAYTLQRVGTTIVVTGSDNVDTLTSIEHLRFTDIALAAGNLFTPQITSNGGGSDANVSLAENSAAVTTVVATDQDPGATISYSLVGGADQSLFLIDAATGALSFINAPDFEAPGDADHNNSYLVTVRASDGTLADDQAISVTVTAVNEAPRIVSNGGGDTATISVPENSTVITTVIAMDQDAGSTISYSLVGGADQGKFQINTSTGALSFVSAPDFEAPGDADHNNSYLVTVRASDGALADDQATTVNVTDVGEAPRTVHWTASVDVGSHPAGWLPAGSGDFNADGTSDLAWYNAATGNIDVWKLYNGAWAGSADVGSHPAGYQPAGFGDYNHDGTSDVLWFNPATRDVDLWKISNGQWAGSVNIGTHPAGYQPALSGDFNGDGTSDVLWYNSTTTALDIWKLSNGQWAGSVDAGSHPAGFQPSLAGDFDGDGTSDVLWYNPANGRVDIWKLSNGQWAGSVDVGAHPLGWQPLGAADFNLDGTGDIAWYNPTTNNIDVWLIKDGQWAGSFDVGSHPAGSVAVGVGDFDHTGVGDVMWRNTTSGNVETWMLAYS
jgi:hypothetical protein